ncbi:hypothetical protein Tco_0180902 [Tanacetum coccineum]
MLTSKKSWTEGLHYRRLFWYYEDGEKKMEETRHLDQEAFNHLMEKDLASWCRAFFAANNYSASFENGIFESFNYRILNAKGKPIITMLEDIRIYLLKITRIVGGLSEWEVDEAYGGTSQNL